MSLTVKLDLFAIPAQPIGSEIPKQAAKKASVQVTNTHQGHEITSLEQARAIAKKINSIRPKSNNPPVKLTRITLICTETFE